jgi:hypothetical protein
MVFNASLDRRNNVVPFIVRGERDRTHGDRKPANARDAVGAPQPEGARRISRESARAMLLLSHAINYLTTGADRSGCSLIVDPHHPKIEAVRILMTLNLEIYFSCPVEVPWLYRIWRSLLGRRRRNGTLAMNDSGNQRPRT